MNFFLKNKNKNLDYKCLLTKKINFNFLKKSNKFCKKPKEKVCFLPLCDLFKLIFSTFFEEDIE
jgi:hypothetical protein